MHISTQFLEGGSHPTPPSPREARARLRRAFERIPLQMVLLGWGLPQPVIQECAKECARHGARLYLWHPFLSASRGLVPAPAWRVIGAGGGAVAGHRGQPEFTFLCPSNPQARQAALRQLDAALESGPFEGVFLDRIRLPSPSADPRRDLGCFCACCQAEAARTGIDLAAIQADVCRRLETEDGKARVIRTLLSPGSPGERADAALETFLRFRARVVAEAVRAAADMIRSRRLLLGLDCFTPTLAAMVGQDLTALASCCDWIKLMTYTHAYGPAGIPYELLGVIDWLVASAGMTEREAIALTADATAWPLPASRQEIRRGRLPPAILSTELGRGLVAGAPRILAGVEMVESPEVAELDPGRMQDDARAVCSASPDGVVISWDLWFVPDSRLELAAALYGG